MIGRSTMIADIQTGHAQTLRDGILNVNKQAGWTSHDVVAKLRGLLGTKRIGHGGTLDPAATGVLPVLLGKGTRIAEYLMGWDKEYRAVLRLGETTDTQDATGRILSSRSTEGLTTENICAAVSRFQGRLRQLPPMYSAVKVRGVPLYRAARAGRTVEREAREVTVHEIEVLDISGRDVALRISCSKGTYIRTLCADVGDALGVGGHLLALSRNRVGPLTIQNALTLEQIQSKLDLGELGETLMSLDQALEDMPALVLDDLTSARVLHGVPVPVSAVSREEEPETMVRLAGRTVRLKNGSGRLLALAAVPASSGGGMDERRSTQAVLPIVKVLAGDQEH